ncbi:MAG: tetratricopeptide repeat protein [Flavobacteriales bacterium]|nr:tetratricopeptide repeat protein [Flavobacteriales bacterium]
MQLIYSIIFCVLLISCVNNTSKDNVEKNPVISLTKENTGTDEEKNYFHHYHKGDSLLESYYTGLLDRKDLKENVINATKCFRDALSHTSDSTFSINGFKKLAECNIILKKYNQALTSLQRCLDISNDYNTYLLIARAYKGMGENELSIKICDSIINIDRDTMHIIESSLLIANIYAEDFDIKAIQYYNIVLEINPTNIKALYGKGLFYQNNQMYSEAVDVYYEIKNIDPFNLHTTFNLGFIFMELHDYDHAINYFTDAIVSEKNYFPAYYARGVCYEKKGNIVYAEKDYRTALDIYPNYLDAKERLEKLLSDNEKYK